MLLKITVLFKKFVNTDTNWILSTLPYVPKYKTRIFPNDLKNPNHLIVTHAVKHVLYRYFLNTKDCEGGGWSYIWVNMAYRNLVLEYRTMLPLYFAQCWAGSCSLPDHPSSTRISTGIYKINSHLAVCAGDQRHILW